MYQYYIKRIFDLVLAFFLIIIFLPIMIIIAILIKIIEKEPVFYNADRLGKNMNKFKMYKFRTMKVNAPDIRNNDGSTFNCDNDPRVTKIGKILRKTSLDELPQLFNVIKGEMSFVGPRPSPLGNENRYSKEYLKKFDVLPGITGYNQATLRNTATMKQRMDNDVYYRNNISLFLDIKILIWTFTSVLKLKNIYRN